MGLWNDCINREFGSIDNERKAFENFLIEMRKDTSILVDAYVGKFNLSARSFNALIKAGLTTVGEVCWRIECLGERWAEDIRNLGKISQKEIEKILFNEHNLFVDVKDVKIGEHRIEYLIRLLNSRRVVLGKDIRCEIADYLTKLRED